MFDQNIFPTAVRCNSSLSDRALLHQFLFCFALFQFSNVASIYDFPSDLSDLNVSYSCDRTNQRGGPCLLRRGLAGTYWTSKFCRNLVNL